MPNPPHQQTALRQFATLCKAFHASLGRPYASIVRVGCGRTSYSPPVKISGPAVDRGGGRCPAPGSVPDWAVPTNGVLSGAAGICCARRIDSRRRLGGSQRLDKKVDRGRVESGEMRGGGRWVGRGGGAGGGGGRRRRGGVRWKNLVLGLGRGGVGGGCQ